MSKKLGKEIKDISELRFIRVVDDKSLFLHYESHDSKTGDSVYIVDKGHIGAAVWDEPTGLAFIEEIGANGKLELVTLEQLEPQHISG